MNMDKIGYEYENNTSYLTIQAMENQKTGYQIKMLLNNYSEGNCSPLSATAGIYQL